MARAITESNRVIVRGIMAATRHHYHLLLHGNSDPASKRMIELQRHRGTEGRRKRPWMLLVSAFPYVLWVSASL
jgi:hypothetical protein